MIMNQAGIFIYRSVMVMYHSVNDEIKMTVPGKTITGGDFYDAYQLTIEYIDKTQGYYTKHGTN